MSQHQITSETVARTIARVREQAPRVHVITNSVAEAFTANLLLAAGAVPSMTSSAEEVADFVSGAGALTVNLGTLDAARRVGIETAIDMAKEGEIPFVLDPVMADRSPGRCAFALEIARARPSVLRGNPGEIDSLCRARDLEPLPGALAVALRSVVAVTGTTDHVTDGHRVVEIANGHALLSRVTATGCAGAALTAACRAVEADPILAAVTALVWMGVAAEQAARLAAAPGGFAVGLIDRIASLREVDVQAEARIEVRA
ncbi:MAG: hydroxyethylthiazole kinase [Pseudomonadota bacterium]